MPDSAVVLSKQSICDSKLHPPSHRPGFVPTWPQALISNLSPSSMQQEEPQTSIGQRLAQGLQTAARPQRTRRRHDNHTRRPAKWLTDHVCADAVGSLHWLLHIDYYNLLILRNLADGFRHLQAHVATSAFDSSDDVDAPKCHPNTRKVVLDAIMSWITIQTAIRIQWILWLNGAAGRWKISNRSL